VVVSALLEDLVARGLSPRQRRLFVIDGAKALRAAIERVFGGRVPVQRCRNHKLRNVRDHLPPHLQAQVTSAKRAAFRLDPQEGIPPSSITWNAMKLRPLYATFNSSTIACQHRSDERIADTGAIAFALVSAVEAEPPVGAAVGVGEPALVGVAIEHPLP
jgi:Transposase, Mutator family